MSSVQEASQVYLAHVSSCERCMRGETCMQEGVSKAASGEALFPVNAERLPGGVVPWPNGLLPF